MTKLSAVLRDYGLGNVGFWCPGCSESHVINVGTASVRPRWVYNGNADCPTFRPSILVRTGRAIDPTFVREEGYPPDICHSYVTDGRIQFLSDSTHAHAGQTVDLPPWPED